MSMEQVLIKDLGRAELGTYFRSLGGQVAECSMNQGQLVCDEDNKKDLAYFRLTEGIVNTAIVTAVDVTGKPIEEKFGS